MISSNQCSSTCLFLSHLGINTPIFASDKSFGGDKYRGGLRQGQRHGYGELTLTDGRVLKGCWNYNVLPSGSIIYSDRSTYEGELQDCIPYGKGKMVCHDGTTYDGIWENGYIVSGKCCCQKGIYEGQFKENLFHGTGTLIDTNKTWTGEWFEGELRLGKLMCKKNDYYIGEFKNLAANGFGTSYFELRASDIKPDHLRNRYKYQEYFGKWMDGSISSGTVKGNGRVIYTGDLKDNRLHGFGTYYYLDGKIVRGMFERDRLIEEYPVDYLEEKMSASTIETPSVQPKKRKLGESDSSLTMRTIKRLVIEKSTLG